MLNFFVCFLSIFILFIYIVYIKEIISFSKQRKMERRERCRETLIFTYTWVGNPAVLPEKCKHSFLFSSSFNHLKSGNYQSN